MFLWLNCQVCPAAAVEATAYSVPRLVTVMGAVEVRQLPNEEEWHWLTDSRAKRAAYLVDSFFRQAWSEAHHLGSEKSTIRRCAGLLLKPEALATRQSSIILDRLDASGFQPIFLEPVEFDAQSVHAAWRYQLDKASDDRIRLRTVWRGGELGAYIALMHNKIPVTAPSAAAWLASLKGSPHPSKQSSGQLRAGLGAPNAMLNFLHTADDCADFVRELAIWLSPPKRRKLYDTLAGQPTVVGWPEVHRQILCLEASVPEHHIDPGKSATTLRALASANSGLAPDSCVQLCKILDEAESREGVLSLWQLERLCHKLNINIHSWDAFVFASQHIVVSMLPLAEETYLLPKWNAKSKAVVSQERDSAVPCPPDS